MSLDIWFGKVAIFNIIVIFILNVSDEKTRVVLSKEMKVHGNVNVYKVHLIYDLGGVWQGIPLFEEHTQYDFHSVIRLSCYHSIIILIFI